MARCCRPPGRQFCDFSVAVSTFKEYCTFRLPWSTLTGYVVPPNDTKYQVSPSRTPFSVTGSWSTSNTGSVRSLFFAWPDSSNRVCSSAPSAHRLKNERGPVGYASAQPEVSISPTNLRDRVSTTVIDC